MTIVLRQTIEGEECGEKTHEQAMYQVAMKGALNFKNRSLKNEGRGDSHRLALFIFHLDDRRCIPPYVLFPFWLQRGQTSSTALKVGIIAR